MQKMEPYNKTQFDDCCNNILSLCVSGQYNKKQIARNDK